MNDALLPLLKISLVIFMVGNLLDMGLPLDPQKALGGLRRPRFVALALIWGFIVGPALAYAITLVIPLEAPYAAGLILIGMTPCAPFLPAMVRTAGGDLWSWPVRPLRAPCLPARSTRRPTPSRHLRRPGVSSSPSRPQRR